MASPLESHIDSEPFFKNRPSPGVALVRSERAQLALVVDPDLVSMPPGYKSDKDWDDVTVAHEMPPDPLAVSALPRHEMAKLADLHGSFPLKPHSDGTCSLTGTDPVISVHPD